ncbi:MAG: hypothetical protein WBG18_14075 [Xanthobacteraceae bacterium]
MLTFSQTCQEHNLAVWKFQRIVMGGDLVSVNLPKDRCLVLINCGFGTIYGPL